MNYEFGAQWRKWDLHVHTPETKLANGYKSSAGSDLWDSFLEKIESSDVQVIGITDYFSIDNYLKFKGLFYKKYPKSTKLFFPNVELRLDISVNKEAEEINLHVIFDNDPAIEEKIKEFLADLKTNIQQSGTGAYLSCSGLNTPNHYQSAAISLKGLKDSLQKTFGKTKPYFIVGAVNTGGIRATGSPRKLNISDEIDVCCDFFFGGSQNTKHFLKNDRYEDKSAIVSGKAVLAGCDAHSFDDLDAWLGKASVGKGHIKEITWIKADTTFEGLKQVINEPFDRCFIGEIPPKLVRVAQNKTKYVKSLEIKKKAESKLAEVWFNTKIEFNPGLVAIIGNKGKGKSALTDIIGLLGNTKQTEACSFLSENGFKNPRDNKAKHFQAKMTWLSGDSNAASLDASVDEDQPELIKYIPQNFLETICNEIGGEDESNFDRELKKVIFSHVSEADRLRKSSLDELIEHKTSEANDTISLLNEDLHQINEEIIALENQSRPEFQKNIENQLAVKQQEFQSHEKSKPEPVQQPQNDPQQQKEITKITAEIDAAKKKRLELDKQIKDAREEQSKQALNISAIDKLSAKVENFSRQIDTFKTNCQVELQAVGLVFEDIVKTTIDRAAITTKRDSFIDAKKKADDLLHPTNENSLIFKKAEIEKIISDFQIKLDGPNKLYQGYLTALELWEKKRLAILGSESTPGSINYLNKQLADLKSVPANLLTSKNNRIAKTKAIHSEIRKLSEAYRSLYAPVHQFIQDRPLARDKFHLNFEVAITDSGFSSTLFSIISRGIAGTFCGVEEGEKVMRNILARHDFNTEAGIEAFLNEITNSIENDMRSEPPTPVNVQELLRKEKSLIELYDFVFSLDYLRPRYTLRMADKELHQLSPGERGTLLLVFYLLIDKGDIPLIIDQPEENLDNQTVFELLVPCIKEAKERRQIIIVTHNPNLAVVCDAEQIIGAQLDKQNNNRMTYVSGAIENPKINKYIVDILEGTRPAFDNRESKYQPE